MKLLYHKACNDLFKLGYTARSCSCGAASGRYRRDGYRAVHNGVGVILGIATTHMHPLAEKRKAETSIFNFYPLGDGRQDVIQISKDLR